MIEKQVMDVVFIKCEPFCGKFFVIGVVSDFDELETLGDRVN